MASPTTRKIIGYLLRASCGPSYSKSKWSQTIKSSGRCRPVPEGAAISPSGTQPIDSKAYVAEQRHYLFRLRQCRRIHIPQPVRTIRSVAGLEFIHNVAVEVYLSGLGLT